MTACFVHSCDYVAESAIEDFLVCALHNNRRTRKILEQMRMPMHCYSDERPIVMPCRELRVEDFEAKESRTGLRAVDDPKLVEVPDTPSRKIHPDFDLTRP